MDDIDGETIFKKIRDTLNGAAQRTAAGAIAKDVKLSCPLFSTLQRVFTELSALTNELEMNLKARLMAVGEARDSYLAEKKRYERLQLELQDLSGEERNKAPDDAQLSFVHVPLALQIGKRVVELGSIGDYLDSQDGSRSNKKRRLEPMHAPGGLHTLGRVDTSKPIQAVEDVGFLDKSGDENRKASETLSHRADQEPQSPLPRSGCIPPRGSSPDYGSSSSLAISPPPGPALKHSSQDLAPLPASTSERRRTTRESRTVSKSEIPELITSIHELLRFPSTWTETDDHVFRRQLGRCSSKRYFHKNFDLNAKGAGLAGPIVPRQCLFAQIRGSNNAGLPFMRSDRTKREECVYCKSHPERICMHLRLAEGVEMDGERRVAADGKRWVVGVRR